ncbi:ATP-binding protein [Streptomyces sp. NPDC001262]|uniref:ATP-binding protein n=1 Tax=Streptomyces sp. NPDC001262 TaxID=3364552 RepID=UPI0036B20732
MWRRFLTLPLVPEAVRQVRRDTGMALSEYGLRSHSAFADAVLWVVSELVTNAVRHAADRSPTVDVTLAFAAGRLVIGVADQDPRLPDLARSAMGEGLQGVTELTAAYGGGLSVEAAVHHCGKTMLVWFALPDD